VKYTEGIGMDYRGSVVSICRDGVHFAAAPTSISEDIVLELNRLVERAEKAERYAAPENAVALSSVKRPCERHNQYWTTASGACMACRAEQAERDRDVLGKVVDSTLKTFQYRISPDEYAALTRCTPASREGATIDDGHGSRWPKCGPGCSLHIVRPGKVQCDQDCAECPNKEQA